MPALPEWTPLDQIGSTFSRGDDGGRVVGILASERAVEGGWAESAAVRLARAWAEAGRKVMLVDGSLQRPSLHRAAGVELGEGLSDATLFGASVGRVAQRVDDGGYFVISAGTAVADTNAVVRSRRWDQIARSSAEAGVTLGVFLRDGESGTAAFLGSASEIVVLSAPNEAPPAALRDLEPLVRLVTGPDLAQTIGGDVPVPAPTGDPLSAGTLQETAAQGRGRLIVLAIVAVVLIVALALIFGTFGLPTVAPDAVEASLPTGGGEVASLLGPSAPTAGAG